MRDTTRNSLRCALLGMVAVIVLVGCSKNRDNHDHPDLRTGEQLFDYHCAECHGDDGTGKLVDSTPANILTRRDVQGIVRYIRGDAWQGRQMPVFATMPVAEANKIAAYLIELRDRYDDLPANRRKNRQLLIDPRQLEKERNSPKDITDGNR